MDSFSSNPLSISEARQVPARGVPDPANGSHDPRHSAADPGTGERPQAGLAPSPPALTLHALSSALALSVPDVCSDCQSIWQDRQPSRGEIDQILIKVVEILWRCREHAQ